jgi:hypothetical protein
MRIELRGHRSDPDAAWGLVGDTDHLNRVADNPRMTMSLVEDAAGFPEVSGELLGPGPVRHRYRELDARWVHHDWFAQDRVLTGPLMRRTRYRAELERDGDGVVPVVRLEIDFSHGVVGALAEPIARMNTRRWQAALDALPAPGAVLPAPTLRPLPGAVLSALERWRGRDVDPDAAARIAGWLQTAPAHQLAAIRPFVLAARWGVDRRAVVQALVEGTLVGAFELYWATRCPRCGGGVARGENLSDLADHATCPSCRIGFAAELDRNVEVLFAAHAAIRPAADERFCTMFPAARPEVLALTTVGPGEQEAFEVELPAGTWAIGGGGGEPDTTLEVVDGGQDEVRWRRGSPREPVQVAPGRVRISLDNPEAGRVRCSSPATPTPAAGSPPPGSPPCPSTGARSDRWRWRPTCGSACAPSRCCSPTSPDPPRCTTSTATPRRSGSCTTTSRCSTRCWSSTAARA